MTDGQTPEIREYDTDGRLRRIFRVHTPARAVTERMTNAWFESRAAQDPRFSGSEWRAGFESDGLRVPDSLPVFGSLIVDASGFLWAELYQWEPSTPPVWVVFDSQGRARGTVQTPLGLEIHDIGDDSVVGVWRDSLGVEYVRQHHLSRNPEMTDGGRLDSTDTRDETQEE